MDVLAEYGYGGLFLSSFLAATVLPFSSELALGVLIGNNYEPVFAIGIATTGNVLGSLVNYALGLGGSIFFMKKFLRLTREEMTGAEERFKKYGTVSLLFAWVPVIGDPLTVVAGALRINIYLFLSLVTIGKLLRYIVVAISVLSL